MWCASAWCAPATVTVPANQPYADIGIDLASGESFRITAAGQIEVVGWSYMGRDSFDWLVGPLGTYRYKKSFS
ncbi:MAG: hypothetical protein NT045_09360, partial [Candidatus Aureabacteria bacterium]|nr:hypothetical protein [Candidatus Auribacterota bacterium]